MGDPLPLMRVTTKPAKPPRSTSVSMMRGLAGSPAGVTDRSALAVDGMSPVIAIAVTAYVTPGTRSTIVQRAGSGRGGAATVQEVT